MSKLSYRNRQRLPDSAFAVPEIKKLPDYDRSHTINATARFNQTYLSPQYMREARKNLQKMRKHFKLKNISF